jgi:lysyl-tRNA synthetase class 2
MSNLLVAALAAVAIGAVLGLLGAGGSIMTTPLLLFVVKLPAHAATTMSLVVVGTTSATAGFLHGRDGNVRLRVALPFALAGAPGAFLGGRLALGLSPEALLYAFAGFMTAASIALLRRRDDHPPRAHKPHVVLVVVAGFALGALTGVLGAGGGFLIVPTLVLLFGLPMREAIGSSLVIITLNSLVGLAARYRPGSVDPGLAALLSGVAIVGAWLGHRLSARVPQQALKRGFAVLVLVVAAFIVLRTAGVLLVDAGEVTLIGERGRSTHTFHGPAPSPGDLVALDGGALRVLTPWRGPPGGLPTLTQRVLDPRRQRAVAVRERVEAGVRSFFAARGFRETRTPLRVPSPGMGPHIRPFPGGRAGFLQTSPEFAMKRLLVGGLEKIFQLAPVFRDEPHAPTHLSEFTMLEWYRAYADEEAIATDTEELIAGLAVAEHGAPTIHFGARVIDVTPPWPRLPVRELFRVHAGVDPLPHVDLAPACRDHGLAVAPDDSWDDRYFRLWLDVIEPRLPADRAFFVTRYPASQAALAVVDPDPDGSAWARRFEAYAGGLELGNAFFELTDPGVQRERFLADRQLRQDAHPDWPVSPLDEGFLAALAEGLPPSAGIAIGVDRLVMLLADEPDIDRTVWLAYQL